jgi:hypothetical protein
MKPPVYKYPQLYHDLIRFYSLYYKAHQNLPKAFRQTAGEAILTEITGCLGRVAAANLAGKTPEEARQASDDLQALRLGLEKIRAFLTIGWEMKFISHAQMADMSERIDGLGRQATRWREWFVRR